jgi:hypothetical protein
VPDLGSFVEQVAAFAKIGSVAPPVTAPGPNAAGSFEGFVPGHNQKNVIEARLHPSGLVVLQPLSPGRYPKPTGFRTVLAGYGSEQIRYTVVRHNIIGMNRFGQNSSEFPFCLLSLAAWRPTPCDLRDARWFRSEQEAIDHCLPPPPPPPEPEPTACTASFADGVEVELRRENRSRWLMWVTKDGYRTRRTDFNTPFFDHARRTAEHWYGVPLNGWQTPGGGER